MESDYSQFISPSPPPTRVQSWQAGPNFPLNPPERHVLALDHILQNRLS